MTVRGAGIVFFTLVLFATTWYYIMKAKQQTNAKNKFGNEPMMGRGK